MPNTLNNKSHARIFSILLGVWASTAVIAAPNESQLKVALNDKSLLQLGTQTQTLALPKAKSNASVRGLAMASADLNIDGYPELISAYSEGDKGFLAIYQGNKSAYSPGAAAFADLKNGIFPPGFSSSAQTLELPIAADLIATGDFNADGDADLVLAKRGDTAIYFIAGSRQGFAKAERIQQTGSIDAFVAGEIDLPNAAIDLAVAISSEGETSLLVYRDGLVDKPLRYDLPSSAEALAIGQLDDNTLGDVAVLAGGKIAILHGYNQREATPKFNRLETLAVASKALSFTLGDFIWDRDGKTEIALMMADGSVAFATRGALNTEPRSRAEVAALRVAQQTKKATIKAWQPGIGGAWQIAETSKSVVSKAMAVKGAIMLRGHFSTEKSDDLIVLDSVAQVLKLLTVEGNQRKSYVVSANSMPVAALAIPTSAFVLPSLIVLGDNASGPDILPSVPKVVFSVSKTADTADGVCNADCSLREAITAANSAAGADSITVPAGTYTLTIANAGGVNEDNNATGDLDIDGDLIINGAAAGTTIIQAGTTNSNGIDKVLAFNPFCAGGLNTGINNATVRFGRNTQPINLVTFAHTGGGFDVCNTGSAGFTLSDVVVDQNTNAQAYGGGFNIDTVQPATGSFNLTNLTASGNRATDTTNGDEAGGAVSLRGDSHNVTITNSSISGNTATFAGGGVFVSHTFGGAVLIQNTTISGNTAGSVGGGIANFHSGSATLTLNNDGALLNNISQGTATSTTSRGGGIDIGAASTTTTTINEMTITGNRANTGTLQAGGGIHTVNASVVNLTFSRIAGNLAGTGGGNGLRNAGATTTATRNWWGCNAGPAAAPCDTATNSSGTSTLTPRLQLAHAASPSTIVVGQTSALTADFLTDSGAGAVAVANLDAIIGTTHAHQNPVRGAHSATQTNIQAAGNATAIFTANAAGAGSSDSVVDSQARTVAITINKANTTTLITSDTPEPSVAGGVVAVNYAVAVTSPGTGTPTGNVVVTISGGAETCTGTVAAGSCNITLIGVGSRTLTATYEGDTNFNGSVDTEPHTVNNPTSVSIAVAPASVNEDGATNLTYTVTRDAALASATVVNITTSGTATSGTDFSGGVTTVTIAASATTATITIDPTVDSTVEADETVILSVASGAGYTVGAPASATGTILNDDVPNASIAVAPASVAEDGAANLIYTVTLNQASLSSTSVNYTVGGTAANGTDYATITSPLVIAAGNTSGTITVNPTADTTIEADETVSLTLAAGTGYSVGVPNSVTGTILNDDLPNLTINDVTASEGNAGITNFTFTVGLSAPAGPGGVGFNIATANGSATAGVDYVADSLVGQTIPAASSTYTFTVRVNGDVLNEPSETYFVNVSSVTGAVVTDGQGQGTITNDDPLPSLSINDVSVTEGNAGFTNAVFTVTLNAASGQTVQVNYATANDTATQPADYTSTSGTLTFTSGQTTQTITVPVVGDVVSESNETYFVNLSGATNATISDNQGIGTIVDDELPNLTINDVSITEGNGSTSTLSFTVTRTGITASAVGFNFATADSTATIADNDYVAASGTGSIPGGGASASTTVSVTINGDAVFENNESFFVNLTAPTNAVITDNQGIGTITNDDSAPTLAINDVSITEGNSGTQNLSFTVTRTGLTAFPATFTATTANGTATAPSDYLAALAGTTTIAAGGATGTTTLSATINGDTVVEPNETFFVNLSAASDATIFDNQGIGTITNDDSAGVVLTQSAGSTDVTEGGATDTYTLVLTSQPTSSVSIALNPGTQVTVATSPVVFTTVNWNMPQTVTVTAVDDAAVEGPHTGTISHTVSSSDTVYNGFTVANVVANITDNDLPTLAINDVSITEGDGGTQVLNFTVTRTGTTPSAVGFSFASADGTATTADSDYVAASGTGTIPSGGATASTTVSVTINGDAIFESTEIFVVNLSAPTNATIADPQGVATISNDDTAPTLAIDDVSIAEGNSGTQNLVFTVTRTGLTALPASFTAATADGTASAPSDYLAAFIGSTTIAGGGPTGTTTVTATINGDAVVEANETFLVNLTAPNNATISDTQGVGTITNDDTAGVVLTQSGGSTDVTEDGATDSYTLVLTSQPTANVSIALNPGTQVTVATSPVVFTPVNWNIAQTVTVTAVNDAAIEGNHTGSISHSLTSSDGNYQSFAVANVVANITDNDAPGVSIVQSGGSTTATEGGATDSYTVVLSAQPSADVLFALTGTQVSAAPTPLTFTSVNWNVPQTVTVTALDDNVVEGAHTGSITTLVTSSDSNYSNFSVPAISVAMSDNDAATVSFAPASVSQSEATSPMAFTATLSNPVASGVTVTVNTAVGTATASDFTAISAGTITFAANSTTAQTVNVVLNNDALDEDDEQFSLALSNVVATGTVTLGTAAAAGTIQDDDALPVLSVANVNITEGNAGTSTLNFVVTLTPASGRDVSFSRATADGTATVANNDYLALALGSVTIPAGQTTATIPVTINGDTVFEGNESFSLNLTAPINATPTTLSATGTIVEDDQQPTATTIVSDLPDPSVVGQSYAVNVQVAAQSTSPLGTVNISDGSASCVITLAAATSPNSSGTCNLTSTTAGSKTLTATYVPASTAFGASTITTTHQVNAATTTLSLIGPATIALNQPASYSFTLAVTAPGAGIPAGIVTVQSGAQNCQVTLPSATTSCAISFSTVGNKAVSASFAPSNSDFTASSTTSNVNTLVFARSDLSVTKTDGVGSYRPNDLLVYTIIVRNAGIDAATQVRLVDTVPASLDNVAWTCAASAGAICPAAGGVGSISQLYPLLPVNGQLTYTLSGTVNGSPTSIVNTASLQLPADGTVVANTPANLTATDTNLLDFLFANGFEDQTINAASGSFTLPSEALRGVLDETAVQVFSLSDSNGEALRVYGRVLFGQLQYALAVRGNDGRLKFGSWQTFEAEPTLQWRAERGVVGFILLSAELR